MRPPTTALEPPRDFNYHTADDSGSFGGFDSSHLRTRLAPVDMALPTANDYAASRSPLLDELQATLEREIPMCGQMGIRVHGGGPQGLVMRLPLGPNLNHRRTAFAGSLNAVCTIAGWGSVFLLLKELDRKGNIVIRRSTIRYHQPVNSAEILARCQSVTAESRQFFLEMLDDKKQAKLDLEVEIPGSEGPLVSFNGSYVVALD